MAVSTYAQERCSYRIGGLKPLVYLLPKSGTHLRYTIDDGTCHLREVHADTIYMLEGSSAKYTEDSSRDTRYSFKTAFTLAINEARGETWQLVLDQIKGGEWYVVFEDNAGVQYIQSVEFPPEYSYTYTFNNTTSNSHQCELRFDGECNFPCMQLVENISGTNFPVYKRCGYIQGRVKDIRMCPVEYCSILRGEGEQFTEIRTFGGMRFVEVEPDPGSFQFRQQYKDGLYTDRIQFTIPLSDYKFYWHYGLEEFTDNRYAVTFATDMGNTIATGFEFGYGPAYTIETSEDKANPNTITITLDHQGQEPLLWNSDEDPAYIDDGTTAWARISGPVEDPITGAWLATTGCQGSLGVYTLVQQVTPTGQPLPRYMCLEGWEETYSNLEIIGTYTIEANPFDFPLTFASKECQDEQCRFLDFPSDAVFAANGETKTFTVRAKCAWTVTDIPDWVTLSRTSGDANEAVQVTITATADPGANERKATLTWTAGTVEVLTDVTIVKGTSWLIPTAFNIDAHGGQTLISYAQNTTAYRIGVTSVPAGIETRQTTTTWEWTVTQPNTSEENAVTYRIGIINLDTLEESEVTIVQDHMYATWQDADGFICEGKAAWTRQRKFLSYTYGGPAEATDEYRKKDLIAERYDACINWQTQWRDTGTTGCSGDNLYTIEALWKRESNEDEWFDSGERRFGNPIEMRSPTCNPDYKWEESGETMCLNGDLWSIMVKTYKGEPVGETKQGTLLESQSSECLDPSENYITWHYDTNGGSWPESGFNSHALFTFSTTGNSVVNFGDGTTQSFGAGLHDVYRNLNATGRVSAGTTIRVSGPVTYIHINKYRTGSGVTLEVDSLDLTHAPYLRTFEFMDESDYYPADATAFSAYSIDLHECRSLLTFSVMNPIEDVTVFRWPDHPVIQRLKMVSAPGTSGSDSHYNVSGLTSAGIQLIVDGAPTVASGIMDFCPNYKDKYDATQQAACSVDFSGAEAKGWLCEHCCGSDQVSYRIVDEGDTECDLTTHVKYSIGTVMESTDGGSTWTSTGKTVRTGVAEVDSEDCGYVSPVQTQWRMTERYECDDEQTSWWLEEMWQSDDYGSTWYKVIPEQVRRSSEKKADNDPACGAEPDIEWQYRFVPDEGFTVCDDGDLHQRTRKQRSWDGVYWEDVYPYEYGIGDLIEADAEVCKTGPDPLYRWIRDGWVCDGTTKRWNEKYQTSADGGLTWTDTGETRMGNPIEYQSEDCGYGVEWVDTGEFDCVEE